MKQFNFKIYLINFFIKLVDFNQKLRPKASRVISASKIPFIFIFFILVLALNQKSFSQNEVTSANLGITINPGGTLTYCDTDGVDNLTGAIPNNKSFAGPGIVDAVLLDGAATFDPAVAGVGSHTITYNNKAYTFTVTTVGVATLDPFVPDEYCETDPAFALTGGLPIDPTGTYYVSGVIRINFDPVVEGAGTQDQ